MTEIRLIDANALAVSDIAQIIDQYLYPQCNLTVGFAASLMPTIEAEPVRHGRWKCIREYEEFSEEMADYYCENCGYVISRLKNQKPKFCEGCGARMNND